MAYMGQRFNVNDLPSSSFEPIPAGWYIAAIVESDIITTQAGNRAIKLRMDILGPTCQGRPIFHMLNIENANEKAVQIAYGELGGILRAIGLDEIEDTDELIGGNLQVKIIVKNDEKYGEQSRATGFKPIGNAPSPTKTKTPAKTFKKQSKSPSSNGEPTATETQESIPQVARSTPPWGRR